MDPASVVAPEHSVLEEKHRELAQALKEMRRELNNFSQKPVMAELLQERERLKTKLAILEDEIECRKYNIRNLSVMMRNRKLVLQGKFSKRELETVIEHFRKNAFDNGKKKPLSESTTQCVKMILENINRPMAEMEWILVEQNTKENQEMTDMQAEIAETLLKIEKKDREYKQAKKDLIYEIAKKEGEISLCLAVLRQCHSQEISVTTFRDRPECRSMVHVRKHSATLTILASHEASVPSPAWKFYLTFDPGGKAELLPTDQMAFLKKIEAVLQSLNYQNLNAELVYKQLLKETAKSKQDRIVMKEVWSGRWLGWKIFRTSKKYRLFIKFDEMQRKVWLGLDARKNKREATYKP